jgi:hypothetical protein
VARRAAADAAGSNATPAREGIVTPGFFETLGVPIRHGRAFTARDTPEGRTAIVNETLAARLFGGPHAVGSRVWTGEHAYEIVGIVADYANYSIQQAQGQPRLFLPAAPDPDLTRLIFVIRASDGAAPLVEAVRRAVPAAAPGHTVVSAFTLKEIITIGSQEMLVGFAPLFPLIAIGMLLTAAGVYGVLAFAITRRARELAVRMAIGASRTDIGRLVAAESLRLIAVGLAAGLVLAFALRQIVRAGGGAGSAFDPHWPAFAVPAAIVVAIGALATWLPVRRAVGIDPAQLLRS